MFGFSNIKSVKITHLFYRRILMLTIVIICCGMTVKRMGVGVSVRKMKAVTVIGKGR